MKVFVWLIPMVLVLAACQVESAEKNNNSATYFARTDSGLQTGGVKMIPIETPKGTFKVWTKRIGNNPRMKL
ncbi:MAG: proline iminopeptidase, partial [Chitinophagaceae bacterium]|nr:proline iminopeptidase [Chitinophagaceae bacterium]